MPDLLGALKKVAHKLIDRNLAFHKAFGLIYGHGYDSMYPEKLCFDGEDCRTARMNEVANLINNKLRA
jgi:hypothetical protein